MSRTALATLAALACCATPAVAAPTAITEFPAGSKAMYIQPSPADGTLWITRQGVGVQQFATTGEQLASNLTPAAHAASADLDVDTDGSVFWAVDPPRAGPNFGGWLRRSPGGAVTKTEAGNSEDTYALLLPSPGVAPFVTGSFPTYSGDCVYSATTCQAFGPAGPGTPRLTGLAVDGAGRLWSFSPEANTAIRVPAVVSGDPNRPPDLSVTMPPGTFPGRAARGPDGNLWVAGFGNSFAPAANTQNRIVRITPQGVQTSFMLPPGRGANDITLGPDGALWFTEYLGNAIGRITIAGQYRSFAVPSAGGRPYGITTGPDRNIWFTEYDGGRVGKLVPGDDLNAGTRPLTPVRDTMKPALGSLRFSRTTFRAAGSGASTSQKKRKRAPVGTRVRFSLSEGSAVRFTVQRKSRGRSVKGKCVAPKRSNRKRKRCTRYVAVSGSFTVKGTPGTNSFVFRGRIGRRSLKPGSYRLTGIATDPSKNVSAFRRKAFRVVR